MAVVEIGNWGKQWTVKRDDETVGRYPTEAEAKIAAEIARCADKWPPASGRKRIRWRAGRWEYSYNGKMYRDIDLDKVIKFRDKRTRNRCEREEREKKEKEATAKKNSGCAKCVWRLTEATGTAGKRYHCGYSLCYGHHSRVWLHYQRTGKESLEGMTFGTDCTEFMAGNPDDKKTLMQEDLTRISEKAWRLLARESGEDPKKTKRKIKETRNRTDMVENGHGL